MIYSSFLLVIISFLILWSLFGPTTGAGSHPGIFMSGVIGFSSFLCLIILALIYAKIRFVRDYAYLWLPIALFLCLCYLVFEISQPQAIWQWGSYSSPSGTNHGVMMRPEIITSISIAMVLGSLSLFEVLLNHQNWRKQIWTWLTMGLFLVPLVQLLEKGSTWLGS